jgi:F-type H+/Na+-transporting ATPase subunit alpha
MKQADTILEDIEKRLQSLSLDTKLENVGTVEVVGDGVVAISGLSKVAMGELVEFEDKTLGLVFNMDEDFVSVILLGSERNISFGSQVKKTGRFLTINASEDLLGRVINPIGEPLDSLPKIKIGKSMPLEKIAAGVVYRKPVDTPLFTGIKAIDSMIPIGRGQRQLIIGDRGTGKSSIAVDAIINQKVGKKSKRKQVYCVYVAIGQKQGNVAQIVAKLKEKGAMDYTVVVSAGASDPAALQYLAPFGGTSVAEYFLEQGKDVLVVYDDLSKHAWAYRQISLVLKRPAGREAYPGDIFYLHSRLLERSVRLNDKYGGGSITALPIVETQAGDISAYIPTNIISITDGQIFLETDLFNSGVRPAINPGVSVSRVGGAAQTQIMRKVAGPLRLDYAQYRELAAFAQFGSDLDKATQARLDRGVRITETFKQPNFNPLPPTHEVVSIFAVTKGFLDDVPVNQLGRFEKELLEHLENEKKTLDKIEKEEKLTDDIVKDLEREIGKFKKRFKV